MLKLFKKEEKTIDQKEILISQFWKVTKEINEKSEQFNKDTKEMYVDSAYLDIAAKKEFQNSLLKEIKLMWNS